MAQRRINVIKQNLTELVKKTNIDRLVPKLVSNQVFTQDIVNAILGSNHDKKIQTTSLYLELSNRGPQAFSALLHSLMESGHEELVRMLLRAEAVQGSSSAAESYDRHLCSIPHSANPFVFPNYMREALSEVISLPAEDIIDLVEAYAPASVRHATELQKSDGTLPDKYPMTSKPRGYALIINNVDFNEDFPPRKGAENDERAMSHLLKQFYFEVESYRNQTKRQMVRLVEEFALKPEWEHVDCSCVVLMSHGKEGDSEEDTEIIGTDGIGFKTREVLSYFYNDCCPLLLNKPKIFIFQSCRGSLTDRGVEVNMFNVTTPYYHRTETDGHPSRPRSVRFRSRSDMFIAHPVPPGIKANRDIFTGAWFIQTIVKVFSEEAYRLDLEDLFKMVDLRIKRMINAGDPNYQTVTTRTIGWNKKLYFNPGLSCENGQVVRETNGWSENGMDVVDTPRSENGKPLTKNNDGETSGCFRCLPS